MESLRRYLSGGVQATAADIHNGSDGGGQGSAKGHGPRGKAEGRGKAKGRKE